MANTVHNRKSLFTLILFLMVMLFLITKSSSFFDTFRLNQTALLINHGVHGQNNISGHYNDAITRLLEHPIDSEYLGQSSLYRLLGSFLAFQGDTDKAKSYLVQAILVDPDDLFANYFLGYIYLAEGDDQKAINAFRIAGAASYLIYQAANQQNEGNSKEAIRLFILAREVEKSVKIPVLQRVIIAWAFYDQGEFKQAEAELQAATKDAKNYQQPYWIQTTAYGALGDFYFRQGFLEKARDQYIEALITSPENYEFYKSLGATHLHLGELDLAEKYLIVALKSENPVIKASAYYHLGRIYETRGDQIQAIRYYKLCLLLAPSNNEYHLKLADAYVKADQIEDGILEYRLLLSLDPE